MGDITPDKGPESKIDNRNFTLAKLFLAATGLCVAALIIKSLKLPELNIPVPSVLIDLIIPIGLWMTKEYYIHHLKNIAKSGSSEDVVSLGVEAKNIRSFYWVIIAADLLVHDFKFLAVGSLVWALLRRATDEIDVFDSETL